MKAVVVYYSLEGNTELIANLIAKKVEADIIKLQPEKEIAKEGFKKFLWGGKSVIFKEKPKLKNGRIELDQYDTIIIGTPIWASSFTPPIDTFLSENKIVNKNIFLFACNAGGGTAKCFAKLTDRLKGNSIKGTADFIDPSKMDLQQVKKKVQDFCETIKPV
ncbi:MAG: Flavodoxin [Herbinix sp.]|jgi:flavodoxin|nr:Flavodoxin [Herbinix sp.]